MNTTKQLWNKFDKNQNIIQNLEKERTKAIEEINISKLTKIDGEIKHIKENVKKITNMLIHETLKNEKS